jgi:hypothetical protein
MLLETLDTKHNDVVIYSQNIFNFERNFKIIYKDAELKKPHSIGYYEVCKFISDPAPKVIIVYRLLTNLANFTLRRSQYGFPIILDNQPDLVFFDPIFAVKELESLSGVIDMQNLRFRIQQLGLNSLIRKGDKANFTEIYSFDLSSKEAITQNDKIFADAIFALDKNFIDDEEAELIKQPERSQQRPLNESDLNTDKSYSNTDFKKYVQASIDSPGFTVEKKPSTPQKKSVVTPVGRKSEFGSFLEKNKSKEINPTKAENEKEKKSMIQIFKSTGQLNEYIHGRNEGPVILKFNK